MNNKWFFMHNFDAIKHDDRQTATTYETIFGFINLIAFVAVTVLHIQLGLNENIFIQAFKLHNIEALSACEVSSSPSNNNGYCVPNYNSSGDSCVLDGESYHVRCSGNLQLNFK
jgi:hypothetical protein